MDEEEGRSKGSSVWILPTAAAMILVLAVVGGFVTPYRMNKTADMRMVAVGYADPQNLPYMGHEPTSGLSGTSVETAVAADPQRCCANQPK